MKNQIMKLIKPLLTSALAFSWIIENGAPSLLFFGEYQYPTDTDK